MSRPPLRLHLLITGKVQGVGFRWFTRDAAARLGVSGWVRNLPGGQVEAEAEADGPTMAEFVAQLRTGLPHARVDEIAQREIPAKGGKDFEIR